MILVKVAEFIGQITGTHEEKLARVRKLRDDIKKKVIEFVKSTAG